MLTIKERLLSGHPCEWLNEMAVKEIERLERDRARLLDIAFLYCKKYHDCEPEVGMGPSDSTIRKEIEDLLANEIPEDEV